jgi:DNA-binding HxlR family transcriptional regulator
MAATSTRSRVGVTRTTKGGARVDASPPTRAPAPRATTVVHDPLGCRAHEVLARVGDKWSVYVIHVLGDAGTLRFGELKKRVEGISQRMLTVTLRSLERDGLVSRAMYPEVPPRVEYALTPLAMTLRGIVGQLVVWSQANLPEIDAARARYDAQAPGWATADE